MKTKARAIYIEELHRFTDLVIRTALAEAKEWNKGDVIAIVEKNGTVELNK